MGTFDLRSDPLYKKVYDLLKEKIIEGKLAPGEHLGETNLAGTLQVSRTPVREALRRLEQDRLIVADANGVYSVYMPSSKDLLNMCMARSILEGGAARLAAVRSDRAQLSQLDTVMAAMIEEYTNESPRKLLSLDLEFHRLLVGASDNGILLELHDHLGARLLHARRTTGDFMEHRHEIIEQHAAILAAIHSGDGEQAERATRAHIMHVCNTLLDGVTE